MHYFPQFAHIAIHPHFKTSNNIGLGGLVVTHSAAGAKGPGFNSPVARAYLRFNSRASTLTGKQCWLCAVRLPQTVTVHGSVVDICRLVLKLQTWRSITDGRSEAQRKSREGA